MASVGHDVGCVRGGNLERLFNREQVNGIRNPALATDLEQAVANTEGRAFALASHEIGNGRLGTADQIGDSGLRVASPFDQDQVSRPAGRCLFGVIRVGATDCSGDGFCEIKSGEPFVHESVRGVLHAPVNQRRLAVLNITRTVNYLSGDKIDANTSNPVLVTGNPGSRINGAANLDMPVAEQADIEEFHLDHLPFLSQLWPVVGVIQWAKPLTWQFAFRCLFNLYAVLCGKPPLASGPVRHVAYIGVAKDKGHFGLSTEVLHNLVSHLLAQFFVFVHGYILIWFEYLLKANLSAPTDGNL